MSTWISKLLPAALLLAACAPSGNAPATMSVADNTVIVAGPPGYCVDPRESRDGVKAFVLMGSCASIARDPSRPRPDVPGVMTVVVSSDPGVATDVTGMRDLLAAYFRSDAGRAALSRTGDARGVDIEDVRFGDGVVFLRVRDRSGGPVPGTDGTWWRALFDVNGRLVTMSVLSFEGRPISREAGLSALEAAAKRTKAASARLPPANG